MFGTGCSQIKKVDYTAIENNEFVYFRFAKTLRYLPGSYGLGLHRIGKFYESDNFGGN